MTGASVLKASIRVVVRAAFAFCLAFHASAAPTVTAIKQNLGATAGGAGVTIEGSFTTVSSVTFDGVPATMVGVSTPSSVTVAVPAHASGTVNVVVTDTTGSTTATNAFTYYDDDDAARDYSIAANPSPRWTYGSKPTVLGTFATFGTYERVSSPKYDRWSASAASLPNVNHNPSDTTMNVTTVSIPAYGLALHPGASGEHAVARWTAPSAGLYLVSGYFSSNDTAGASTDVYIVKNGSSQIYGANVNAGAGLTQYFSQYVSLGAGGTLDFQVGYGGNGYANDATGLQVTISKAAGNNIVTNTGDTVSIGSGSLRAAIAYINSISCDGADTVLFNIADGPQTISIGSALPAITCGMTIDGYTQSGSSENNIFGSRTINVTLDGSGCAGCDGLTANGSGVTIKGLAIRNFSGGAGIRVIGGYAYVYGNHIGTDAAGVTANANGYGVYVQSGSAYIGYQSDWTKANLISGNTSGGVYVATGGGCALSAPAEPALAPAPKSLAVKVIGAWAEISSNYIGGPISGSSGLGNGNYGVKWENPGGCTTVQMVENYIRYNSGPGVILLAGGYLDLYANYIYGNSGTAFDLGGDGVTANDTDDVDDGANGLVNKPTIAAVSYSGSDVTITAELRTSPSFSGKSVRFDFFHNDSSPSVPEGKFYMGYGSGTVDATGFATNTTTISGFPGQNITATATVGCSECTRFTSEYSYPKTAAPAASGTFGTASAFVGSALAYEVQLSNPNAFAEITGLTVAVTIPGAQQANFKIDSAVKQADCSPGGFAPTVSSSSASLPASGIPAGGTCTFTLTVHAENAGTFTLSPSDVVINSDAGAASLPASSSFTATLSSPTVQIFVGSPATAGAATSLTIAVGRTSTQPSFSSIGATLTLPGGATVTTSPIYGCSSSGASGTGGTTLTANNGSWSSNGSCSLIFTNVTFPTSGSYTVQINAGGFQFKSGSSATTFTNSAPITASVTVAGQSMVSLAPGSLAFGNVAVGTSATLDVTVTNTGSVPLTFSPATLGGSASFAMVTPAGGTPCGTTLAPGNSCNLGVRFTPSGTTPQTATLTINSSAANSPSTVSVSGTGTAASISVSPATLAFGSVQSGSTATLGVTLTNTGNASLSIGTTPITGSTAFSVTAPTTGTPCAATLAAGASCSLGVRFAPTAAGAQAGTLTINSNAANGAQTVSLGGTGTAPAVSISPSPAAFGSVAVNSSATLPVTVANTGSADLVISGVGLTGAMFSQTNACATVAPGSTCTITVKFTPTTAGPFTATLTVTSNAAGSPHAVSLSGTGTAPGVSLTPTPLTFGAVLVGSSTSAPLTLKNTGSADLSLGPITVSGTGFTETHPGCGATLAPGASCTITVTFAPTSAGSHTGQLNVSTNASTASTVAALSGTGAAPAITITPSPASFGNVVVGTQSALPLTVVNTGNANLVVSSVTIAGTAFSQTHNCIAPVGPSSSCTITVLFSPSAAVAYSGSVTVSSNASASATVVALSGNGATAAVSLSPASLDFGSQTINTASAVRNVAVTNAGNANLSITSITVTGDFSFTGCATPLTLVPGASCTLAVKFFPTATGARAGSIVIVSNASGSPHALALAGNGTPVPLPAITLAPASANFGSIFTGTTATRAFALSNTGTANLAITSIAAAGAFFSATHNCPGSLAPNGACNIVVTYAPTEVGTHSGELEIVSNATPSPFVAPLTGSAAASTTPGLRLSASSVAFPPQFLATPSAAQTVTLTSSGTAPLQVSNITVTGDFGYSGCGYPATLAPGATCNFDITFRPFTAGALTGSITIASNAPGSPHTISLSGTGSPLGAPAITLSPQAVDFGTVRTGRKVTQRLKLTSSGVEPLGILNIQASGTGNYFSATDNCPRVSNAASLGPTLSSSMLQVGASCDIDVSYEPMAAGTHSGQLAIDSTAIPRQFLAAIAGTAATVPPPFLSVEGVVQFGSQALGTTTQRALRLRNTGGDPLVVTGLEIVGPTAFTVSGACGTIAPDTSCDLAVTFTPTALQAYSARLDIVSNHAGGVVQVQLTGTGVPVPRADLTLSPAGLGFGNQGVYTDGETKTVTVTSTGSLPLSILSLQAPPDYVVVSGCALPVEPGASCDLRVRFRPVVAGPRTGSLVVNSNAPGSPHSVSLVGVGCRYFQLGRDPSTLCAP